MHQTGWPDMWGRDWASTTTVWQGCRLRVWRLCLAWGDTRGDRHLVLGRRPLRSHTILRWVIVVPILLASANDRFTYAVVHSHSIPVLGIP